MNVFWAQLISSILELFPSNPLAKKTKKTNTGVARDWSKVADSWYSEF